MKRRDFLKAAALGAPAFAVPGILPLIGQDGKKVPSTFQEIIPEQVQAIDKGLKWLANNQFSSGGIGTTCQVAFTGVAGLAFLANNSTAIRGPYAKNVRQCLKFLLRCSHKASGYINEAAGRGLGGSGIHGHGYAT